MNKENIIFDLTNPDWDYRGVLFAELDNEEINKMTGYQMPAPPKDYCAGVMAIIWKDKEGFFHMKLRIKFPSGSKQVYASQYPKDSNETIILQDIYKVPMINKCWKRNEGGTGNGIIKIIEELDMIESMHIENKTNL